MTHRVTTIIAAAVLLLAPVASHANLVPYAQSFETMNMADPAALSSDGWVVYGNVYSPSHVYMYGYGTFPAPNNSGAFCAVATGEGGAVQGLQQLSVYSDYNNTGAQTAGQWVEADVFHEQTIGAADIGARWTFQFDAKLGNLVSPTTALAFIKTIDPLNSYATTNMLSVNMTAIPNTWGTFKITIPLGAPALAGQLLQFGFASTTTLFAGSGVFYDNVIFSKEIAGVGDAGRANVLELRPAAPNPFAGATRLDYSMPAPGGADLSVYDVTGRRVATLFHGAAPAGPNSATWNGRQADGGLAPVGIYRAVLQTPAGRTSRSLVLSR